MTRVAVIGNAAGGKSTLCRRLSLATGLPHYAIDRIQWKPNWVEASSEEVKVQHEIILSQDRWIIDGWGGWDNIKLRFDAADTIILVDYPVWIHYWWAAKRQIWCLFRPRQDGPEGCPMAPMTGRLFAMIEDINRNARPRLLALVDSHRPHRQIFHLRSPRELRCFIRQYCR